jgi:TRAP-type C4-dicarboxylate transport system permease small subunit
MNGIRIIALILIVGGAAGLAYGSFSYTKSTNQAKIGPIELNVKETQTVNIPMWAGLGAIVLGGLLLLGTARKV